MLRIYNTLTRQVEPVEPVVAGAVSMYTCGPTVYRYAHVGNMRTYLMADVIRRVLAYSGLDVHHVMNITDVGHMTDELRDAGEDKMLLGAEVEGKSTSEIAQFYTDAFLTDVDRLAMLRAHAYPRASEYIPQMQELIAKLIERGHAYEDGGTVYYDVTTFPGYGRLSGQSIDEMRAGHRIANQDHHKRHHQDFVLWKSAGPRRVLVFDSPWGSGYPGWHIECSAMSMALLGERFDVHTGGEDNRFPHHECEIAQSEGVTGRTVVTTWVHGHHLLMGRAKMAKSAGNVLTIQDLVEAGHDPLAFRHLCFSARYRRQTGLTDDALHASGTALRRLRERIAALGPPAAGDAGGHEDGFVGAITDDLDLPTALKVLQDMLADDSLAPGVRAATAARWDEVLGLRLVEASSDGDVDALIAQRDEARSSRDFARADTIRDELRSRGIELIDTPSGTRWVRS